MRRTGRPVGSCGLLAFDFIPPNMVDASANQVAADRTGARGQTSIYNPAGVRGGGNVSNNVNVAMQTGTASEHFSPGGRYFFGAAADAMIAIRAGEDFTLSAIGTYSYDSTARAFIFGSSLSGGTGGAVAFGVNSTVQATISAAPGTFGTGDSIGWTWPVMSRYTRTRWDLCRVNGLLYAWVNGAAPSGGSAMPYASSGSYHGGGAWAVGGVGEYSYGGGDGGAYGERWRGPIERVVLLKGVGLYTAPFDPIADLRPFMHGQVRR